MRANIKNMFIDPTTSALVTPITSASSQLKYAVDGFTALSHREDTLNPLGVWIQWSALTNAGTNSYRFQVQESTDVAGATGVLTVADTGAMLSATDPRLLNNTSLFIAIDWNLVTEEFLTVLVTLAGNGTPSISIVMAVLCNTSDIPRFTTVAANYTP